MSDVTIERIERAIKLEDLALDQVRKQFPQIQRRKGFTAAIQALDPCLQDYRCGIVPDGWFAERDDRELSILTCIEIEDSHPLSIDKLRKYCELWFALDSYDHDLRLFVFDRYGLNQRELNLCRMLHAAFIDDSEPIPLAGKVAA